MPNEIGIVQTNVWDCCDIFPYAVERIGLYSIEKGNMVNLILHTYLD